MPSPALDLELPFVYAESTRFRTSLHPLSPAPSQDPLFFVVGFNYWHAPFLALPEGCPSSDPRWAPNLVRLQSELDAMRSIGINVIRVMAAFEGPETEPYRSWPCTQPKPGEYNEDMLKALDVVLHECKLRHIRVILCLNNYWHWSGGMAQYVAWTNENVNNNSIPYPPSHPEYSGSPLAYFRYVNQFYSNEKAVDLWLSYVEHLLGRVTSASHCPYVDDATIFAWELVNEPRYYSSLAWLKRAATLIKQRAPKQMLTIGIEGFDGVLFTDPIYKKSLELPQVDFATCHLWVQNWGFYEPADEAERRQQDALDGRGRASTMTLTRWRHHYLQTLRVYLAFAFSYIASYVPTFLTNILAKVTPTSITNAIHKRKDLQHALHFATSFLASQAALSLKIDKPMLLEEYGLARDHPLPGKDNWKDVYDRAAPTLARDAYFSNIISIVESHIKTGGFAGQMMWSWGGTAVGGGDPAHERPGWYSLYSTDESTLGIIKAHAQRLKQSYGNQ
ncbi:glycoside hydrolase superfamily [Gaertneriomyces semiglobifer]|nr:glycoside hydrolase superfamily [Gaertneriomyces semiglobifer]